MQIDNAEIEVLLLKFGLSGSYGVVAEFRLAIPQTENQGFFF